MRGTALALGNALGICLLFVDCGRGGLAACILLGFAYALDPRPQRRGRLQPVGVLLLALSSMEVLSFGWQHSVFGDVGEREAALYLGGWGMADLVIESSFSDGR